MFVILMLFSLIDLIQASSLKIDKLPNWELKQNFIGQDYVLVEGKLGKNSLLIKKIALESNKKNIEKTLLEMIEAKKIASSPWKNIKILDKKNLSWDKANSGSLFVLDYEKNEGTYSTIIGGYPIGKDDYYFIYYSDKALEFNLKKNKIIKLIQDIKIQ